MVIHEVSNLKEVNYSDKFWNIVQKIDPNY